MSETQYQEPESSAKRRKVRKGTQSCWECKRRKTKCVFASSEDVICIGCQRRSVPCVSQEMPEDLSPAVTGNRQLGERIARVEGFMKDFLTSKELDATKTREGVQLEDESSNFNRLNPPSNAIAPSSNRAPPTPAEVGRVNLLLWMLSLISPRLQPHPFGIHQFFHRICRMDHFKTTLKQLFITCSQPYRRRAILESCSERALDRHVISTQSISNRIAN